MARQLDRSRARLSEGGARLDALSPLRVLERGYAVARDASGGCCDASLQFAPGLGFRLRVHDGEVAARVGGA